MLKADTPVYEYASKTGGPVNTNDVVQPPGGWETPHAEEPEEFRILQKE